MSKYSISNFDAKNAKEQCIEWIKEFFEDNGNTCNAIVGISGGKDSSVVAALCVEALGKERVIGVLMPNGEQPDIEDSEALVRHLGIKSVIVNISSAVSGVLDAIKYGIYDLTFQDGDSVMISQQTITNLPARIRMATLYAVSQSNNGRVANTCNLSEDYIGYSTRYGDAAGDFCPISSFTTEEVVEIGRLCGLPSYLVEKTPSDGLCGKSDEDNIGFAYRDLNDYIRNGEKSDVDSETVQKIKFMHQKNLFKMKMPPAFEYCPFWESYEG